MVDPVLAGGTQTPAGYANNTVTDISPLLLFSFWQPVYYLTHPSDRSFSGDFEEKRGRWVGISENIGGYMTSIIITKDGKGQQIKIYILCAVEFKTPNHCTDKEAGVKLDYPEELCSEAIYGYNDEIEQVPIISDSNKHQSMPHQSLHNHKKAKEKPPRNHRYQLRSRSDSDTVPFDEPIPQTTLIEPFQDHPLKI